MKMSETSNKIPRPRKTHGDRFTKFYRKWIDMKSRCNTPTTRSYPNYGGRGISICPEWSIYENFKKDMYESYLEHVKIHGEKQTTLERKDVNGNYCLSNCKWATYLEQHSNRTNSRPIKATYILPGPSFNYVEESKAIEPFARKYGLDPLAIHHCLNGRQKTHRGWMFEGN